MVGSRREAEREESESAAKFTEQRQRDLRERGGFIVPLPS
jgi:hypothetical protein